MKLLRKIIIFSLCFIFISITMINGNCKNNIGISTLEYEDGGGTGTFPYDRSMDVYDYPPQYGGMYLIFHSRVHITSSSSFTAFPETYTSNMLPTTYSYRKVQVSGNKKHIMNYSSVAPDWTVIPAHDVVANYH